MATTVSDVGADRWAHLPAAVREEIDVYETELRRVQQGQMSEKVFLEFRLRHGVYGQRQARVQMQRIKIPLGILNTEQMIRLADLSEEYADGVSHITTRQDIQYHFLDIDDTPNMIRSPRRQQQFDARSGRGTPRKAAVVFRSSPMCRAVPLPPYDR